ncbi:MAG TPA: SIMPL domain-containing protein [Candidatus Sulfotelmatobacter sp.]|nr:SIMPL domain-containing protein [Candidatus Sulfotelmatobacter sp.]
MKRFPRIAHVAVPALALAVALPAAAPAAEPPPAPTLSVTGVGVVERAPDRAIVTFGIITNDDRAAAATSANNAAYAALAAKLDALGVRGPSLRTLSFGITFQPRPPVPNPQSGERYGFVVTRNVSATTDDVNQVGALIDAGVAAGVTNVDGVAFTVRDERTVERTAQAAAVADAAAQAEAIAAAAHVRLTGIASIGSQPVFYQPQPIAFRMADTYQANVPTNVQPGSLSIRQTVTVVYRIAP